MLPMIWNSYHKYDIAILCQMCEKTKKKQNETDFNKHGKLINWLRHICENNFNAPENIIKKNSEL